MKRVASFVPLFALATGAAVMVLCGGCKSADETTAPPTTSGTTNPASPETAKATEAALHHDKRGN